MLKILDAHTHFFDIEDPGNLTWPKKDSGLYSTHLPETYQNQLSQWQSDTRLIGVVAIETSQRPEDDQWLFGLAQHDPLVLAVIANLNPTVVGFQERLRQARASTKFRGVRLRPIAKYNLQSQSLIKNLSLLLPPNHVIETGCPTLDKLTQFTELAKRLPEHVFVLDHFGHPDIKDSQPEQTWVNAMRQFANLDNTYCKITSMRQFATDPDFNQSVFQPYLSCLLSTFGDNRVFYGSNWPAAQPLSHIKADQALYRDFFGHTKDALDKFFCKNAQKIYAL